MTADELDSLLAEQVAYYRARAAEYDATSPIPADNASRWRLAHARSPEMLAIASSPIQDDRVRFIEADVFAWRPDRRYDVLFFSAWLSHVPPQRCDRFWTLA
jgi:demethylmenaquinone methyltransferase/2-methoxy-6-polyprenyl-1,4-benzoquinol methylase